MKSYNNKVVGKLYHKLFHAFFPYLFNICDEAP